MKKTAFMFCWAGMLLFCLSTADAATLLKKLGQSPFSSPPPASVQEVKDLVQTRQTDIYAGLAKAGQTELYEPLMVQFPKVRIETVKVKPDERMQWMMFKKGKKVRVIKDVIWSGQDSFKAYQFFIDHNGQRYEIIVAQACGNIALKNVAPIPNQSPACRMQVSPDRLFSGQQVNIDAGASADTDGAVAAVRIALLDSQGRTVEETVIDRPPFVTRMTIPAPGAYRVTAVAIDDEGAEATSAECDKNVEALRRGVTLADAGYFWLPDPAHFMAGRVGYEYRLNERYSLAGMVGIFAKVEGHDGASAFTIDGLFNIRSQSGFFAGLGVGGWISDGDDDLDHEDSGVDMIANIGQRIWGDPEEFNTSIFAEARVAFDEFDDFVDFGRFGVGLRLQF